MRLNLVASLVMMALANAMPASAQDMGAHKHNHRHESSAADTREFVKFPPPMIEHMLTNMRDHLASLQGIQEALAQGKTDTAARIAETRLGMSSLESHGAAQNANFMPKGMREAGSMMHRAASQFAVVATDAGVSGDLKPALAALAKLTSTCVGCHAGYKIH